MAYYGMDPCWKCGEEKAHRESLTLTGRVHAILCLSCRTAYDGYALAHPLGVEVRKGDALVAALRAELGHSGNSRELTAQLAEQLCAAFLAEDRLALRLREEVTLPWLATAFVMPGGAPRKEERS